MKILKHALLAVVITSTLAACGMGGEHADLRAYVDEIKRRPAGSIDPLPAFRPYEAFIYSAAALRSPFDLPIDVERRVYANSNVDVKPDFSREKEFLEGFDLTSLRMVGTIRKAGTLWALVRDVSGRIHMVTDGHFLGKNHGKVIETVDSQIELIEIVSDGLDGWVERPSVLALAEKE